MNDLKFAFRQLAKNFGFTTAAVLTLALGIGACTAMFSIINAVMLRPLPFADPERLVWLEEVGKESSQWPWGAHFLDWHEHSKTLDGIGVYDSDAMTLSGVGEPERVEVGQVSSSFLPLLGAQPLPPGRALRAGEDRPGRERVAILSHDLWQHRYKSDPAIIGGSITLDDTSYSVIGVLPPGFRFFRQFDVWVPLALDPQRELTGPFFSLQPTIARLKPGVTIERAQTELNMLLQLYERTRPEKKSEIASNRTRLVPLREHFLGNTRRPMLVLLGAVGMVLLIACVNVADLLLARAATRQRELAIRSALGASRARLTRQALTECVLLSAMGGVAGLLFAYWLVRLFNSINLTDLIGEMAQVTDVSIDPRVFGFALFASLATGLLFGMLPALRSSRPNLSVVLREGAHGSRSSGHGLRGALIIGEVAMAMLLLAGAGLLVRSFIKLATVNPGYRAKNLLTAQLKLPPRYDSEGRRSQFYDSVFQRAQALPGVEFVGATSQLPLTRYNMGGTLRVKDARTQSGNREVAAPITAVNSDYFHAMGIALRAGRLFDTGDRAGAASVVVLSESLARKLFPTDDPIGRQIFVAGSASEQSTVIGVVDDIRHQGLDHEIEPAAYLTYRQLPRPIMAVILRTTTAPSGFAAALRQAVGEIDPTVPLYDMMTMEERLSRSIAAPRFNFLLLGAFSTLALLLAAVGVYGVVAYLATERTREIGIRMALGATRGSVLKIVLGQGMKLAFIGVTLGTFAALMVTRLMTNLLFEVKPGDPVTLVGVAFTLLLVALFACWLPARRAARVDPITALRTE